MSEQETKRMAEALLNEDSYVNGASNGHVQEEPALNMRDMAFLLNEVFTSRTKLMDNLFDSRRDIDTECGYPKTITAEQFRTMYERNGIAERVVNVYPEETWGMDPVVKENDKVKETDFEKSWRELEEELGLYAFMERADELSGIGRYGVMLLGFDDGRDLKEPLPGLKKDGTFRENNKPLKLLYVRTFDEESAKVSKFNSDKNNPRYGYPEEYDIKFLEYSAEQTSEGGEAVTTQQKVHWSRIIHIADNRKNSEVFATPRQQPVWNRLYDIRKMLGGSGEMYWRGAFPGISLETMPGFEDAKIDTTTTKERMQDYMNGLQRYMLNIGMTAKSLPPQVESPRDFLLVQLQAITITIKVPLRIFLGSEAAQLASGQDTRNFNRRIKRRQHKYVSPFIIKPFVERLIQVKAIIAPSETTEGGRPKFEVDWPDIDVPTEKDQAEIGDKWAAALQKYVTSGIEKLVPPLEFLTMFLGVPKDRAKVIVDTAKKNKEKDKLTVDPAPDPSNEGGQFDPDGNKAANMGQRNDKKNASKKDVSKLPGDKKVDAT